MTERCERKTGLFFSIIGQIDSLLHEIELDHHKADSGSHADAEILLRYMGEGVEVGNYTRTFLQEAPEPGIADHFGYLLVILFSGSWRENRVPPKGWTSILTHGGSSCVDIKRTLPYHLFNGYDEFEI